MAYDFPSSPTPGQEYTPPVGGQTYVWQPPRWLVKGIPPTGSGGGGGIDEAPIDGQQYGRQSTNWTAVTPNPTWSTLTGKPATFPPTVPIAQSDITNLVADQTNQDTAIALKAPIASPTFTGDPKAPTPTAGDSDTSIATTAFVTGAVSTATVPPATVAPVMDGTAAVGTVAKYAKEDHRHPTDTTREPTIAGGTTSQFWRGDKTWQPITIPPGTTISDTAPGSPVAGQLWWESDSGAMFLWYVDANSSQWVQVNNATAPGATAGTRNRVVNGAMQISQENGNTLVADISGAPYLIDQWSVWESSGGVVSAQRVQVATPRGSSNRIRMIVTTADTSITGAEQGYMWQYIEGNRLADLGFGTAQARPIVLRFGWRSPAGVYSVSYKNAANNRSFISNFTVSAGQANIDTEQVIVITGDTTGTWPVDNTQGASLIFAMAVGPTYQGALGWNAGNFYGTAANTNGFATVGNTFDLFDVGFYADPQNTGVPPPWQMPDEAQELLACQRYWRYTPEVQGVSLSPTVFRGVTSFSPPMRTTPAVAITLSTVHVYNIVNAPITGVVAVAANTDLIDLHLNITSAPATQACAALSASGGYMSARL